jgi:hypothetical protein
MIAKVITGLTNTTLPGYAATGTVDAEDLIGSFHYMVADVDDGPKRGLYQLKAKEGPTTGYFIKYVTSKPVEVGGDTYQLIAT